MKKNLDSQTLTEHFLTLALEEARKAKQQDEVPVGAVMVRNGVVIAAAHNQKEINHNVFGHAEMLVIQKAVENLGDWRLTDCVLYSTLEPCPMCAGALLHARIKKVVFGAKDLKWGAAGSIIDILTPKLFNHQTEAVYHPMEACGAWIRDFFREKRSSCTRV